MDKAVQGRLRIEHRTATDLADIRADILTVYAEAFADRLGEEFHSVPRFDERLGWNAEVPGFSAVIGYISDRPAGFAYGCTLQPGTRWWNGLDSSVPATAIEETGTRTFALSELMVIDTARGTGVARQIHDALLHDRDEQRATLLVEQAHERVRARYEEWGYQRLGTLIPFPDAPTYDAMLLALPHPRLSENTMGRERHEEQCKP
ncbi:GNAT family N-acetyltransferase [Streptomyces palmae]|uniref:GNAT family N-acetyltransferase n=1 Tax=Streptomyces palmae TaxID=1701085 RepID=A0A4Z0HD58_9ACTN|nr:GNAT family N-acetyltransferase [Streptomyces palmae]TGB10208.1 GNAT family N-acetyltransferase [Streptomyces palmae]